MSRKFPLVKIREKLHGNQEIRADPDKEGTNVVRLVVQSFYKTRSVHCASSGLWEEMAISWKWIADIQCRSRVSDCYDSGRSGACRLGSFGKEVGVGHIAIGAGKDRRSLMA
jgi:hypothetical protein